MTGAGGGGFAFSLVPPSMTEEAVTRVREALEGAGYTVLRTEVGGGGVLFILMRNMKLKPILILCKSRKLPHSYSHSIPHTSKRKKCISFQVNLIYMKGFTAPINTKRSAG